jgi:hypothetical protein
VRLSPAGTPIVVDVPLLPGESVTTDGVRAETKDGRGLVKVNLGPADDEMSWRSTLAQGAELALAAPVDVPWLESWLIEESPLWHVTKAGIPAIHDDTPAHAATTTYRPWPGEKLTLTLARPAGVAGQTLTIDAVDVATTPGLRSTDVSLTLHLRSSRGAQHPIRLPAGSELIRATINGATTPLRPEAGVVTLPLSPGAQTVVLQVRLPTGVSFATRTPTFDVGADTNNVTITLAASPERWTLFCRGPGTGPALLFWSTLLVITAVAIGLGRVPRSPLSTTQWVLLSLGLTQVHLLVAVAVAGWLLVLGWRRDPRLVERGRVHDVVFDLVQLIVIGSTLVGLGGLIDAIQGGLLGAPDMQVRGNGSSTQLLRWFVDRTSSSVPVATSWSVPLTVWRVVMLAWSFWLVRSLLRWLRDGFAAFGEGGYYREPWLGAHGQLRSVAHHGAPRGETTTNAATTNAATTNAATTNAATTNAATTNAATTNAATNAPTLVVPEAPAGAPTSAAAMSHPTTTEPVATTTTTMEPVATTTTATTTTATTTEAMPPPPPPPPPPTAGTTAETSSMPAVTLAPPSDEPPRSES